ncbi:MAG: hypothetical protein JWQ95_6521 [Sphaerisporangium sp.]|jgi:1,4-alpha-glucan branching enzyme|nr:hypothetical protein [Sphaerisporangium sp.]
MITRENPGEDGMVDLVFTLPAGVAAPVSVVGDFNGWDPHAHPMPLNGDGLHTAIAQVPQGTSIRFRYLADGGIWLDDADADAHDEHGGIIHIPDAATRPGKR